MRSLPYLAFICLASALLSSAAAQAQAVAPSVRIVNAVDERSLVTLKGNTHPLANATNDRGRVSPDLPMTGLILVLSRSPEQQAAFDKFVASQYDPGSPNFHKWLSPDEVGADFGPAPADIAVISNWLTGHGFSIAEVAPNRMSIRFGGTAAQVESAFHTEIHNLEVNGVHHIGNMSDPQIPSALTPVVVGIKSLHNFFPHPQHRTGSKVTRDPATGKWQRVASDPADSVASQAVKPAAVKPQFGISVTGTNPYLLEDVSPYDFAAIYNVLPLWNASTPINGTGQTIAIAGTSNICLGQTDANCLHNGVYSNDVASFRSTFGLPAYTASNQPSAVSGNGQPLKVCTSSTSSVCSITDLVENSIDVEWAGAVAPGAKIVLVSSYPASPSDDGLYDSESYIINNKTASIMNVSYGGCELYLGTAGNVEYYNLWQTAYAEGIAVFVASGDGGAAECDDGASYTAGNPYSAQVGLAVNGLASTPLNTAVGGTDFNWCSLASTTECTPAPYWNSTNAANGSSARGYVPEVPWNDTCANPLMVGFLENWATSSYAGDVGGVTDPETGCNFIYNNWQTIQNTAGVDLAYFVDTVGGGGGASGCVVNDGNNQSSCTSSTTTGSSYGSVPLVNDGWPKPGWQAGVSGIPNDGVRDLPDVAFFASTGSISSSAYLMCVSALATCTYSSTVEPLSLEVGGTSVSSPAMAGVMALINQKAGAAQGNPNAELYNLASQQTYSGCSAETVTTSSACLFNDIDTGTNAVPCDYGADEGGASGTGIVSPNCSVNHAGDLIGILPGYNAGVAYDQATGLGSLNVANVVNAWPVITGAGLSTVTVLAATDSVKAGSPLSVAVTVVAALGGATPTGTVTLLGGGYSSAVEALASGAYSFTIPANSLAPGSDTLTVTYSGDSNYASTTGSAAVTVAAPLPTPTVTVIPSAATLTASTPLSVAVLVAAPTGSATPTGTVTLSGGGYTSAAQSLSSGIYTFTVPANSLTVGTDTLTVTYSGDTNYSTSTGTAAVTVTSALAAATVTVTPAQTSLSANSSLNVTTTVASASGSGATPTGTVALSGGGYSSSAGTLASGVYTFAIPASSLAVGTDTLTVTYSGDTNYASNTGTASVTVSAALATATVTVTPAQSTLSASSALSVTATVASASGSGTTPTGTVTLSGGGYSSSAGTLASGVYTFAIPANSLAVGTDTLTVTYSGDLNYASNTGTASVTVTSASSSATFTLSATTPTAVAPGSTTTSTITVTTTNGYVGTATITCALTSSPTSAVDPPACALSSSTVQLDSSTTSGNVTATISTTAATASLIPLPDPRTKGKGWMGAGGGAVLAFLVFLGIPARRRSWRAMLGALLLLVALTSLSACGDFWKAPSGNSAAGTTAGNYTFTVTGTGNPTVTAVTTTFVVTVN
ncbi:MAG TPA: Ig-like domain repeat protein [Dongiaceae bacterium]|nr:Ig-like domain repeat protein [Dongiaceae bacterium]